jgi:hypothetical protein
VEQAEIGQCYTHLLVLNAIARGNSSGKGNRFKDVIISKGNRFKDVIIIALFLAIIKFMVY